MVLGILQFEVLVHGSESLKDKRRVVQSLKDRLHREHLCAVAEVGDPDMLNAATMAAVIVCRDGKRAGEILDAITIKLRDLRDGEVTAIDRQVLHGQGGVPEPGPLAEPRLAPDAKSGDGSDKEAQAWVMERALEAEILEEIERERHNEDVSWRGGGPA